jgi:hypothetical protein
MKNYLKNLLILIIFSALFSLLGAVPKVYMEHDIANFNNTLSAEAQARLKSGDLRGLMHDDQQEAIILSRHYTSSYTRIFWASELAEILLILLFSWILFKANKPKVNNER